MSNKKTYEEIREFWTAAASVDRDSDGLRPVARDPYLQQVVEEAIESRLPRTARVLDVGCGDGQSTVRFAKSCKSIVGVDYVSDFVERARTSAEAQGITNTSFFKADVLSLTEHLDAIGLVDAAITIRCLINLDTWEKQATAIRQIAQVVKPGGLYLLSEGWKEGMDGLNELRTNASMPPIETVPYNLLIARAALEREIQGLFAVDGYINLGFYIVMSRFLQPSVVHPDPPRHDHAINAMAAELQRLCRDNSHFVSADYAGVYVLRRLG